MSSNDPNYFDKLFQRLNKHDSDESPHQLVIEAYLYRKRAKKNKSKTQANYDEFFWNSTFIYSIPTSILETDDFILALTRYFTLETVSNYQFIATVLHQTPEVIRKSIRRSQLVLKKQHLKWEEIRELSKQYPQTLEDLIKTSEAFQFAHKQRLNLVKEYREPLLKLTLFELLSISAAYSFKHQASPATSYDGNLISTNTQLRALTKLVHWKLSHASDHDLSLNDHQIALSLKKYLIPLIFPSEADTTAANFMLRAFSQLIQAQVELDEFLSQSVDPFCFDDSLHFSVANNNLTFKKVDSGVNDTWDRNGDRQKMLRGYWFNIAIEEFIDSGMALTQMGSAENHERNQVAYLKAMASKLELEKIYGFTRFVHIKNGFKVDLFQALLSQELMIAFYLKDYIEAFQSEYSHTGNWQRALSLVALQGVAKGQNRFPITWSPWKDKINSIIGWTVSKDFPNGNINAAEAILAFWCLDMKELSQSLQTMSGNSLHPLTERPIFKVGKYCIQLPWLMSSQLSSLNAVNNLRRFANQRSSLKEETTRIESKLGDAFEDRGFAVLRSYTAKNPEGNEAGEIDLVCAIDDIVFIIEVKSTYHRTTQAEIIYHRDKTLRKAGIQVRKKVKTIKADLQLDSELQHRLQLTTNTPKIIGWIADTSIEFDHEFFSGFLKITIEELFIALADNAYFLCNQEKELSSSVALDKPTPLTAEPYSLYENRFSGQAFIDAIERSLVWRKFES